MTQGFPRLLRAAPGLARGGGALAWDQPDLEAGRRALVEPCRAAEVAYLKELEPAMASMLQLEKGALYVFMVIAHLAVGLVVFNAMLMTVQRIREFGIWGGPGRPAPRWPPSWRWKPSSRRPWPRSSPGRWPMAGLAAARPSLDLGGMSSQGATVGGMAFDPVVGAVLSVRSVMVPLAFLCWPWRSRASPSLPRGHAGPPGCHPPPMRAAAPWPGATFGATGRRTLITLASIAFGFLLAATMLGISNFKYSEMVGQSTRMGLGQVSVLPPGLLGGPGATSCACRGWGPAGGGPGPGRRHHGRGASHPRAGPLRHRQPQRRRGLLRPGSGPGAAPGQHLTAGPGLRPPLPGQGRFPGGRQRLRPSVHEARLRAKASWQVTVSDLHGDMSATLVRVCGTPRTGVDDVDNAAVLLPLGTARRLLGYGPDEATALAVALEDQRGQRGCGRAPGLRRGRPVRGGAALAQGAAAGLGPDRGGQDRPAPGAAGVGPDDRHGGAEHVPDERDRAAPGVWGDAGPGPLTVEPDPPRS